MADPLVLSPLPISNPTPAQASAGNDAAAGAATPSFAATLKEKIDHPASTKEASVKEDSAADTSAALVTVSIVQPALPGVAAPLPPTTDATDPAALIAGWLALPVIIPGAKPVAVAASAPQRMTDAVSPAPTFMPGSDSMASSITQATTDVAGQPASAVTATVNDRQIAKFATEPSHSADKPAVMAAISAAPATDMSAVAPSDTAPLPVATIQPPTLASGEHTVNATVTQLPIVASHPDHPVWASDLGQRLTWMIGQQRHQAELVLSPPHLGTLEITLKLDGNQASASFVSPHPAVREALDQALPRLREMLADAGVTLGQTHVGAEQRQAAREAPTEFQRASIHPAPTAMELQVATRAFSGSHGHGMVDIFA